MFQGNTHLIQGNADTIPTLLSCLEKEGIKTAANPDMYIRWYTSFGAPEARELRDRTSTRALAEGQRIFIIAAPTMTNEAQNALLKTLEEPPADAMFFIIVSSPETLLPTLRSRMQYLILPTTQAQGEIDVRKFIAAQTEKRIDMLKPLLEKGDDDPGEIGKQSYRSGKRDIGKIIAFLSALEREVGGHSKEGLRAIYRARKYIGDKGVLAKPLLEQVALLLPRV